MQARAGIANLSAGHHRRAVVKAGGGSCAAGTLGNVLVDLAILVRARAKTLDGSHDHLGVQFLDALPGKAHAIQGARCKVFNQYVTFLDQLFKHCLAFGMLGVQGNGTLVMVEHGEIQAIRLGYVTQLAARNIALTCTLDLDHVRTEPCQQLGTARSRLDVGKVKNAYALQRLSHQTSPWIVVRIASWRPAGNRAPINYK